MHRLISRSFLSRGIVSGRGRQAIWSRRSYASTSVSSPEAVHSVVPEQDDFDKYLDELALSIPLRNATSIDHIYRKYHEEAGTVIDRVVPYEERPPKSKRADARLSDLDESQGDGLVLVVHAQLNRESMHLTKTTVCSGFVVNASLNDPNQGDTIITCAHTLEEMNRYLRRTNATENSALSSFSFVVPLDGRPRVVTSLLSSMPRSDVIAIEVQSISPLTRLRPLPLSPFPVYPGTGVLTHLFGSPDPPTIQRSIARTRPDTKDVDRTETERPISWANGHAWRRWGSGMMLGYRSYTGLELEAGISSVLPHILTSILPMSGSSGGPLVHAENGTVVGMTSGRRMDNRVEGERGWGCSAEKIFEMFSLPGFTPSVQHKHPYP